MKPKSNIKSKLIIRLGLLVMVFGISTLPMAQGSPQAQSEMTKSGPTKTGTQAAASQQTASKDSKEQIAAPKSDQGKTVPQLSHKVIAYYFHGKFRCSSCKKIEAYTQEAIQGQGGFADPLKSGRMEWHVINVEDPSNEHFVKDFQLYTKSVVIVDIRDGKQKQWKNLAKVWELLYDKGTFVNYVRDEINAYLAEKT